MDNTQLLERATKVYLRNFLARRKYYAKKHSDPTGTKRFQNLENRMVDNLHRWFDVIEARHGRSFASKLYEASSYDAFRIVHADR